VLAARAPGPTFVVSRTTDRSHARRGPPLLTVDGGGGADGKRRFAGASINHRYEGTWSGVLRRLPGAQAAAHPDRRHPELPARVRVIADDGTDQVALAFETRAAAQLIASDPFGPGCSFIHELVGPFEYQARIGGRRHEGSGLAVVEHVA